MKKYITLLLAIIAVSATYAQRRGRILNETDFPTQTSSKMKKVGSRTGAPLPCTGSPKIPVVLVQFSDTKFLPASEKLPEVWERYQGFFNGSGIEGVRYTEGNSVCSVRDYFVSQSDSIFKPDFTVMGPITLDNGYAYYGEGKKSDYNINKFYSEACKKAASQYNLDWTVFDNNKDGVIDFIFFIYAGEGENYDQANTNLIWPKEWTTQYTVAVDDKNLKFGGFGCTNETLAGEMDGIGTCCHELSHALGLPDLYPTNYTTGFGMDYIDLMDSGCYEQGARCPVGYSAYERDFMGWKKLETISYDKQATLTLLPLVKRDSKAYKILNPNNPNEYFILENRQNLGNDQYLCYFGKSYGAMHGLLIYHVEYVASYWSSNVINNDDKHQRYTIVPADGNLMSYYSFAESDHAALEKYIKSMLGNTYPGYKNVTEMSSYAVYTGGTINMKVDNIRETEDKEIILDLNGGDASGIDEIAVSHPQKDNAIYDLSGRRVTRTYRGIYIVNGKKVMF